AVVVEIHPETGEVLLPETTITEDGDGLRTAHAMVHNGALCYLRATPVTS
ncbi:MAG TPA: hypothetical protein GX722_04075, partial [Clostridiales bacterium]|nr:hypothetical protein [Clostridiales bacterium]